MGRTLQEYNRCSRPSHRSEVDTVMGLLEDLVLLQRIFHVAVVIFYDTIAVRGRLLVIGAILLDRSRFERHGVEL
jgi:hypothetical protein